MTRDAKFYFANLGADVSRCLRAADDGNEDRYNDSLDRAYHTLDYLRNRPEVHEEGLLLLRGLAFAKDSKNSRNSFRNSLNKYIATLRGIYT